MSAYKKAVEADAAQLLKYWTMGDASGELVENGGGAKIKLTNGPTYKTSGSLVKGDEGAVTFDGTNDYGQVALDLSAQTDFTVEFLLNWSTNANDDDFVMEHSATANTNPGFNVDWNSSADGGGTVSVKWREAGGQNRRYTFTRPSAGAWHHVVLILTINGALVAYVDGVSVTVTARETEVQANKFPSTTLNLFSRNGASLFGKGSMAHLAFYSGALSKARVEAHYAARSEEEGGGAKKLTPGQATESDTAVAPKVTKPIRKTLTPATESSTAQARTAAKRSAVGAAGETDTAVAPPAAKRRTLTPAAEVDTAQPAPPVKPIRKTLTAAAEVSVALARGIAHRVGLAAAIEAAVALPTAVSRRVGLTPALEADAALAGQSRRLVTLGIASESDVPVPLAWRHVVALQPAAEASEAQEISYRTADAPITLLPAVESNEALAPDAEKPIRVAVVPALEVDGAHPVAASKPIHVGLIPATETEAAVALLIASRGRTLTPAEEASVAVPLMRLLALAEPRIGRVVAAPREGHPVGAREGHPALPRKGVAQ